VATHPSRIPDTGNQQGKPAKDRRMGKVEQFTPEPSVQLERNRQTRDDKANDRDQQKQTPAKHSYVVKSRSYAGHLN